VHSVLPEAMAVAADSVLRKAGIEHAAHPDDDPLAGAEAAAADPAALALIGPFRSQDVAEALEVTAPVGLPLLAPMATWAGITRDDEPGCDDAADHRGTVFRLVARDTEVARRLALDARATGRRAHVIAGVHDYGRQLDGQLLLTGIPRAPDPTEADFIVLCGLVGEAEIEQAAALRALPIIAFDGVQGADLGWRRDVKLALPFAPLGAAPFDHLRFGEERAAFAAELVASAVHTGADARGSVLAALRPLGAFDPHGDLLNARVWLWRVADKWLTLPDRPLPGPPTPYAAP
jgi:hypothetical protein